MRSHRLKVVWTTEYGQQYGVGHHVESGEGPAFAVQVRGKRFEAGLQLLVDVTQYDAFGNFSTIATLQSSSIKLQSWWQHCCCHTNASS